MGRQFFSWTSGIRRRPGGLAGEPPNMWSRDPFGRGRGQTKVLRSGWFWTAVILAILLIAAVTLLSTLSPTPIAVPLASTPLPSGQAAVVPPYDPNLGLAGETPWGQLILDMVLKLLVIIALIIGVVWLLRFVKTRIGPLPRSDESRRSFTVLDSGELGPGHAIYTVDMGLRVLVLGATAAGVTLLSEISDTEEIEYLRGRSGVRGERFDSVLAQTQGSGIPLPFQDVAERLKNLADRSAESHAESGAGASSKSG